MTTINKSITINAPIEKVWAAATQQRRWPEWYVGLEEVSLTGGETNTVGQSWAGKFNVVGKIMVDFEGSLVEIEEHKLYKTNTKGPIDSLSSWMYEAHDDGTTTVSVDMEYELSGALLGKIADKLFVERKTASDLQETMESFKRIIEAE
jgi:uncharacterized membrane protein